MAQTKEGGIKLRQTMIKRHGSEEAWKAYMRKIAAEGGKVKNPNKGFGYDDRTVLQKVLRKRKLASEAGRKGGTISRRRKSA